MFSGNRFICSLQFSNAHCGILVTPLENTTGHSGLFFRIHADKTAKQQTFGSGHQGSVQIPPVSHQNLPR